MFSPQLKAVYANRKNQESRFLLGENKSLKHIWFHCSSYGEFEGILPLLIHYSNIDKHRIIVTFFSSSGFDPLHTHPLIDYCCYLPFDTKRAMKAFIKTLNPDVLFVSQNEYWPNMIKEIQRMHIPIYYISTYVRPGHWWLKKSLGFISHPLKRVNHIFLQDRRSFELMKKAGYDNIDLVGNVRVDQVILNAQDKKEYPKLIEFVKGSTSMICGSTLASDEKLIFKALEHLGELKLILVPHDPESFEVNNVQEQFKNDICFLSRYTSDCQNKKILIIDSIGDLKYLYRYAQIAFVGGGFEAGVHSVLEAAAYHIPILTGPNISKFQDAVNLSELGILRIVQNSEDLIKELSRAKQGISTDLNKKLKQYLEEHSGSTQRMLDMIRF